MQNSPENTSSFNAKSGLAWALGATMVVVLVRSMLVVLVSTFSSAIPLGQLFSDGIFLGRLIGPRGGWPITIAVATAVLMAVPAFRRLRKGRRLARLRPLFRPDDALAWIGNVVFATLAALLIVTGSRVWRTG